MNIIYETGKQGPARAIAAGTAGALIAALVLLHAPLSAHGAAMLTDQSINDAIEADLVWDTAVPSHQIDVVTIDGVVRLSGAVNSIMAKERAERIAETIRGVRSIVNTIEVVPYQRPDEDIRQDVENALFTNPATESFEIGVKATNRGAVTLSGQVESWHEKDLAERIAKGVLGVRSVENDIVIEYANERTDADIQAEIKEALRWNRLVDDALIEVNVDDATVKLTGTVGSLAEKRQARYDAWTAGVKDVDDSGLQVQYWARDDKLRTDKYQSKPDNEVADAINDALIYDPRVASFNVDVSVDDGVATLRGVVGGVEAKQAAEQTARNTVGVWRVKNLVKIRPADRPTDAELEKQVSQALKRNPYVERFEVTPLVIDGTVYISGVVSTYFEKTQAETAASQVKGTVDVVNNLVVSNPRPPLIYDPYISDVYPYDYAWYQYDPAPPYRADWVIREDVRDELWWSPFVDSEDVKVSVDSGVVTLTGEVDNWLERSYAVENAYQGGAVSVIDKLEVDYGPSA